jgi:hypothetical protein
MWVVLFRFNDISITYQKEKKKKKMQIVCWDAVDFLMLSCSAHITFVGYYSSK